MRRTPYPATGNAARQSRRRPVRRTSRSDSHPPARQQSPPKKSGIALTTSDFSNVIPWTFSRNRGIQLTKNDHPKLPNRYSSAIAQSDRLLNSADQIPGAARCPARAVTPRPERIRSSSAAFTDALSSGRSRNHG